MKHVVAAVIGTAVVATGVLAASASATAATTAPTVAVSQTEDLAATGQQVVVSGHGFDEAKGIYVAVCVDNGPGVLPSPCIGGVPTADDAATGGVVSSAWISSNPPSYAAGLTTPYGPGGSFTVTLLVVARDPVSGVDCTVVRCAVVTRADHTRTDDRSQDTRTPLTFSTLDAAGPSASAGIGSTAAATRPVAPSPTHSQTPTTSATSNTATPSPAADDEASRGWMWWLVGLGFVVLVPVALSRLRRTPPPPPPAAS